jgi:hypothetical protein
MSYIFRSLDVALHPVAAVTRYSYLQVRVVQNISGNVETLDVLILHSLDGICTYSRAVPICRRDRTRRFAGRKIATFRTQSGDGRL